MACRLLLWLRLFIVSAQGRRDNHRILIDGRIGPHADPIAGLAWRELSILIVLIVNMPHSRLRLRRMVRLAWTRILHHHLGLVILLHPTIVHLISALLPDA